jgi:hypothetical protein
MIVTFHFFELSLHNLGVIRILRDDSFSRSISENAIGGVSVRSFVATRVRDIVLAARRVQRIDHLSRYVVSFAVPRIVKERT